MPVAAGASAGAVRRGGGAGWGRSRRRALVQEMPPSAVLTMVDVPPGLAAPTATHCIGLEQAMLLIPGSAFVYRW